MDEAQIKATLTGAANLAPPLHPNAPNVQPFTVGLITCILARLDPNDPLDAAIGSCLTTTFYTIARSGEFTVPALNAFDPKLHITRAGIYQCQDHNGLEVTAFKLPKTKCSSDGEEVFWATQDGPTDPQSALDNHYQVNNPPMDFPLFSYRHSKGLRPLTKRVFLERINVVALSIGEDSLKGHSIRIGATLEYLL